MRLPVVPLEKEQKVLLQKMRDPHLTSQSVSHATNNIQPCGNATVFSAFVDGSNCQ